MAGDNALVELGLSYSNLARLAEEGLIRSDFNEWVDMNSALWEQGFLFDVGNQKVFIVSDQSEGAQKPPDKLRLVGPVFTKAGQELRSVVEMKSSEKYLLKFADWLKLKGLILVRFIEMKEGRVYGKPVQSEL